MVAAGFLAAFVPLAAFGGVPKVGDPAPDFTVQDQDGRTITRDSLRGRKVVLAFYPKDFTGG
jgi:peroxiredoxin Q/BCP